MKGAMDIFWRQGFKATNLPDLLKAMGLTRGSFYKAFGDKEKVYLGALEMYDQQVISGTVQKLGSCRGGAASDCLLQLFSGSGDGRRGCFLCNAIVELGADNAKVADKANAMTDRLRGAILDVLMRYDVTGRAGDAAQTADLILHLYFGYQALGKAGESGQDWSVYLEQLVDNSPKGLPG